LLFCERGWIGRGIASSVARQTSWILGDALHGFWLEAVRHEVRYASAAVAQLDRQVDDPVIASHERVSPARIEYPSVGELDLHGGVIASRRREHWTQPYQQRALRDPRRAI
jgi:hypothetical protein